MVLLCCGINRLIGQFSSENTKDLLVGPGPLWCLCKCGFSSKGFLFLFEQNKSCFALVVNTGEFCENCNLKSQEILLSLRTLTYEVERTWDPPTQRRREPPGHKPLVVNVAVGPFEKDEEGIGITSDVVEMKGEELDSPGYLRGDRAGDFQSGVRPSCLALEETLGP